MKRVFITFSIYLLSLPVGKIALAALLTVCLTAINSNEPPGIGNESLLSTKAKRAVIPIDLDCAILDIEATNFSAIDNNNTTNCGDDTFTSDVVVTFSNPPGTGTLDLSGDATASVDVTQLSSGTHTFHVTLSADGHAINLTA